MKYTITLLIALLLSPLTTLHAAELKLFSPLDYQVVQRNSVAQGRMEIAGELVGPEILGTDVDVRIHFGNTADWIKVPINFKGAKLSGVIDAPAGGWYRVDVRVVHREKVIAEASVKHVGVGEVFVVAGQSNSANHGEAKQTPQTGRVASFDGTRWQLAADPQPGASGMGGSFMPPLGDELVKKLDVPVGFIACGIGATSVREWLPKGATFPNPPTIESRVEKLPDGTWASKGKAYDAFIARMKPFCPEGFRAVLWHQGESDANQKETTRTLSGKLYRENLERLIHDSRRDTSYDAPWIVAQASYHVPGDESSDDIRTAQASLWKDGIALQGPDSDAFKGKLRERDGQGVHFSDEGLRAHGIEWANKLAPWLQSQP